MIARALTLAGGLSGAVGLSQFPEYSQQYLQRLGGAVDELTRIVTEFDSSAAKLGLTRTEALADLAASNGKMAAAQAETMARTVARYTLLVNDLAALKGAGPFTRVTLIPHMSDPEIASRAWDDFKPAIPVTFEGLTFAGAGFVAGLSLISTALRLMAWPFRRKKRRATA